VDVVDPSGAGDAFAAGLIAGLVRGFDLRGCLAYGSALGASCVRSIGCSDAVLAEAEARRWMAERPLAIRPA
jgi:sugar/nucleoside kinase (ribokinase family)